MELSSLTRVIAPTLSREIYMRAKNYSDVIDFTLGDPDMPTPSKICEVAAKAMRKGNTHYTPNAGILELREAIASYLSTKGNIFWNSTNVVLSAGATEGIYLALKAILNPGDEVLIIEPYWVQYENITKLCSGIPIIVKETDVLKKITHNVKAIIINSPNNPSGKVYSTDFMKEISDKAKECGCYIVTDEVYDELYFRERPVSISKYCPKENLITVGSFSKAFAMTGWRLGYVAAEEGLAKEITKLQQNLAVCANSISQYAAIEAISNINEYTGLIRNIFQKRLNILEEELESIPELKYTEPQGSFYMLLDISSTGKNSIEFSLDLLEKKQVAVIPGIAFGKSYDNYVRLAFTLNEEKIREGIKRIRDYVRD